MKKIFSILIVMLASLTMASAQSTSPRFGTAKNQDNTGRVLTYAYATPAYDDTVTVAPNAFEAIYNMAALTGNQLVLANVTKAHVGDKLEFMFVASGGARTVTFGTGLTPSATLVVDSGEVATCTFIFNGSKYIEYCRAKQ